MSVRLNENQYALLNQQAANAILIAIDCLYKSTFEHASLDEPDVRRNLANFLEANMHSGMLIEEIENLNTKEKAQ